MTKMKFKYRVFHLLKHLRFIKPVKTFYWRKLEEMRQETIKTNQTHSQWVVGWLYKGQIKTSCSCRWCTEV